MNITERDENGITIFVLEGRVDTQGAVDMDLALQTAAAEAKYKMILDMAEVPYISSAGLRTLADVITKNRENGGPGGPPFTCRDRPSYDLISTRGGRGLLMGPGWLGPAWLCLPGP